jgi:hypothetical protein
MDRFAIMFGVLAAGFFLVMFLISNPARADQRDRAEGACEQRAVLDHGFDRRALVIESTRQVDMTIQVRGHVRRPPNASLDFVCIVSRSGGPDVRVIRLAYGNANTRQ